MWKCKKENIITCVPNPILVVPGLRSYHAIQRDGTIIASGRKLKRYYDPDYACLGHRTVCGYIHANGRVELRFPTKDTNNANGYDTVCVWR